FFPTGAMSQSALEQMIGHVEGLDGATAMANGAILGQGGETWLNLKANDGPALWFSAGAFSQANLFLNPRLVARVMELCAMTEGESGLDLFCGAGNFSIPLAVSGVSMSGVDFSEHAVASADRACQANSLVKAHFTQEDCLAAANTLIASRVKFSAVILNPPRAGAGEVFQKALELTDRRIVYVACDPAPLARDAALAADSGFKLTGLDIFDMFPHTPHMETVALFEKE
ncbi:MAG: methyltransferase, partial [Nitrospinota bacterium]|nr:methyltransferase [Nitrospinota bacterium]